MGDPHSNSQHQNHKTTGAHHIRRTWMKQDHIDIMSTQETKEARNKQLITKAYTWYFPGSGQANEYHGVGIIVRNELRKDIKDVIPINN